ncbi:hypothetical protein GA0070613_4603 [Micromonospora inositola]|uniref:Uncharacterized protein n=1 Tax=Micromonospora inositola TaxID=47865 RepID=A0A1C5JFT6_9ACTN|nr:hypothetical protein GA0070613_4603 [Micromonospora inositola]
MPMIRKVSRLELDARFVSIFRSRTSMWMPAPLG